MGLFLVLSVFAGFVAAAFAPWLLRVWPKRAAVVLSAVPLGLLMFYASLSGRVLDGQRLHVAYPWAESLGITLSFACDGLAFMFALLITGVGFLVTLYSAAYLAGHPQLGRFLSYLLMFMGSMLGLVLANNLILLFIFWELTSLTSWLLIGFDHSKPSARDSAWQALLVTAAGGLALLGAAVLIPLVTGTGEISSLAAQADALQSDYRYPAILLLVLLAAFTKSAQFPFYFWLPNAMAAPSPVSAYLHSATMVKAGIYLLARLSPALGGTQLWELLVTATGTATMVIGAILALTASDLKRILAYLTVSALGTLTMLLGVGTTEAVVAAMVFLLAHAFYKGSLFLIAGAVDHETGTRDLQQLGGLRRAMPVTAVAAVLAGLSLASFGPFLSFIGKELLLEALLDEAQGLAILIPPTVFAAAAYAAGAGLVAWRPFFGLQRTQAAHEAPKLMLVGPLVLASFGILLGVWPEQIGTRVVAPAAGAILGESELVHLALWHGWKLPLWLSLLSLVLGVALFLGWKQMSTWFQRQTVLVNYGPEKWYRWVLEGTLGFARLQTRGLQSGYLRVYIATVTTSASVLMGYVLFRRHKFEWPGGIEDLRFWELCLAAVILTAAVAATQLRSRLGVIAALSVVGFGVALVFVDFSAPDLAMTQFLAETLVVVLLVVAFFRLPNFKSISSKAHRLRDLVISLGFGAFVAILVAGAQAHTPPPDLAAYYAEQSLSAGKGRNIVNVILVDFRALDTLGEITVLAIAAVGVYALLRLRLTSEK